MCSGSRLWCRALVGALLVALGASLELYDQPPSSEDLFYQDGNDIDTGPSQEPRLPHISSVMLRRLVEMLQQGAPDDSPSYRPSHLFEDSESHFHLEHQDVEDPKTKGPVYKRLSEVFGAAHRLGSKNSESTRPQQKWKIKKGKAMGSPMLCYFKLCAFRSPA